MRGAQKQMWLGLLEWVDPKKTDKQPSKILVPLWQQLKSQGRFQLVPTPQAKLEPHRAKDHQGYEPFTCL